MDQFTTAFLITADILAYAAGVVTAIVIAALAALVILGMFAWCFDRITAAMARRWHKRGKKPRSRIGRIIYQRSGDV